MSLSKIIDDLAGQRVLFNGNEAMARGALEAGVQFVTSYPGSPSSEVTGTLARVAGKMGLYVEWSVNEIVALEAATAASFAGLRALCTMKADGLNVALDFLTSMNLGGCRGGLVLVVADDPMGHSSLKEYDSRLLAKAAWVPVLEPSTIQEALEMTREAFELAEQIKAPVMVRSVTRISHSRSNVVPGPLDRQPRQAQLGPEEKFYTLSSLHMQARDRFKSVEAYARDSRHNLSEGSREAETAVICCGTGLLYAREAVKTLSLGQSVRLVRPGLTLPLPADFVLSELNNIKQVLFIEETRPFLEEEVLSLYARHAADLGPVKFYGKLSGDVAGVRGPSCGEMNADIATKALAKITGAKQLDQLVLYSPDALARLKELVPPRDYAMCPGCPHRASFWAVKTALAVDGRDGLVTGDIGCYSLGAMDTGFGLFNTMHCMGAGAGIAGGLGKLGQFGFQQPVVSLVGDSTFYHAVIPALINGKYSNSNFLCVVLDNGATAMTGHQPHPGTGFNAAGETVEAIPVEDITRGLGIRTEVRDPFRMEEAVRCLMEMVQEPGVKILVLRQPCALVMGRVRKKKPRVYVRHEVCRGDACGCGRFCTSVWVCPGNIWDAEAGRAAIDEAVCAGCGVCASLCPAGAIVVEEVTE